MRGFDTDTDASRVAVPAYTKGVRFACRYLGRVTNAEVEALHAAGLMVVLVWEREAQRALGGASLGASDGRLARAEAQALGAPDAVAIYATADFDALPAEQQRVLDYFTAFAKEAGATGVYASGVICQACRDQGIARYTWVPDNRWRGSKEFIAAGNATIVQDIGDELALDLGIGIDSDLAIEGDIGAWLPEPLPPIISIPSARDMQRALNAAGYGLTVDGIWGIHSAYALSSYYRDHRG